MVTRRCADTCAAFPKGAHDDDGDALSQLVAWIEEHPHVEPASAVRLPDPWFTPRYAMWPDALPARATRLPRRRFSRWIFGHPVIDDDEPS